jgi:hypothetical protein
MRIPLLEANIITTLGLTPLSLEERAHIVDEAAELVEARVFVRLFDVLSPEKADRLRELIASDSGPEIAIFLETEVSDFEELVSEEILAVKRDMAGLLEDVRSQERGSGFGE